MMQQPILLSQNVQNMFSLNFKAKVTDTFDKNGYHYIFQTRYQYYDKFDMLP